MTKDKMQSMRFKRNTNQKQKNKSNIHLNEDMNQSYVVSTQKSTWEHASNNRVSNMKTMKNTSIAAFED